jgi:hypothetical protein
MKPLFIVILVFTAMSCGGQVRVIEIKCDEYEGIRLCIVDTGGELRVRVENRSDTTMTVARLARDFSYVISVASEDDMHRIRFVDPIEQDRYVDLDIGDSISDVIETDERIREVNTLVVRYFPYVSVERGNDEIVMSQRRSYLEHKIGMCDEKSRIERCLTSLLQLVAVIDRLPHTA